MARYALAFVAAAFVLLSLLSTDAKKVMNVGMNHQYMPGERHTTFNPVIRDMLEKAAAAGDGPNNNKMGGSILPVGIYWMSVYVGTPPQHFSAAVDSGSGDLIVPAITCVGCHPENTGQYNPNDSSTSVVVPCDNGQIKCRSESCMDHNECDFSNSYQTCNLTDPEDVCTVSGPLYYESFTLGGLPGKTPFGAITYQTSNFQQFFVIDAVLGFIPYASSWGGQSLFQTLADNGEVDNVYAMCLNATNGGVITLGGVDDSLRTGDFMWTPQTGNFGYTIRLLDIQVGGESQGIAPLTGNLIVDSGTNVLLQRTGNFLRIKNAIISQMCTGGNKFTGHGVCDNNADFFDQVCYPYTPAQLNEFPPISLVIDNATLTMSGREYNVLNGTTGMYCYGVKDTGKTGLDIVGDNTMQNYYVVFDNDRKTLGWAPVDAAACNRVRDSLTDVAHTKWEEVKQKHDPLHPRH